MRVVLFFSGCAHECKGCHNEKAHDFKCGIPFDFEWQNKVIEYVKDTPFIKGITLSGGDPMFSAEQLIPFVLRFKEEIPRADIWIYSGFTYEQINKRSGQFALLALCDVLVDGPFLLDEKDEALKFKGSRNQRVIDVRKSLERKEVVLFE